MPSPDPFPSEQPRPALDRLAMSAPLLLDGLAAAFTRLPQGSAIRRRLLPWVIRRSFSAQERWDVEFMVLVYEPDVVVSLSGAAGLGLADRYEGHNGWRQFYADFVESFTEPRYVVKRVLDAGDRLVFEFHFHAKGRASGAEVVLRVPTAVRLSARGKIERQDLFWQGTWEDAMEAAGLLTDRRRPLR
jgi:ketosteroid isomerase-like protein